MAIPAHWTPAPAAVPTTIFVIKKAGPDVFSTIVYAVAGASSPDGSFYRVSAGNPGSIDHAGIHNLPSVHLPYEQRLVMLQETHAFKEFIRRVVRTKDGFNDEASRKVLEVDALEAVLADSFFRLR